MGQFSDLRGRCTAKSGKPAPRLHALHHDMPDWATRFALHLPGSSGRPSAHPRERTRGGSKTPFRKVTDPASPGRAAVLMSVVCETLEGLTLGGCGGRSGISSV